MTAAHTERDRWIATARAWALSFAALALGLVVPPLPLIRRRAYHSAGILALLWAGVLVVFFFIFYGPAALAHLGLWLLASIGMLRPHRLARIEASLARKPTEDALNSA